MSVPVETRNRACWNAKMENVHVASEQMWLRATIPGNCNLKSCLEDPEVADDNNEYDSYEDPKP